MFLPEKKCIKKKKKKDREKDENCKKCMKRRKLMREHIQNAHVSSKNNKIMDGK